MTNKPILFIEHHDSFSHNAIAILRLISKDVIVIPHENLPKISSPALVARFVDGFSGVVLSPGPGHPREYSKTMGLVERWPRHLPLLGICLGLQIVLHNEGCLIERTTSPPKHGSQVKIDFPRESRIFRENVYNGTFVLFNSLGCRSEDPNLSQSGWDIFAQKEGMVMAAEHSIYPWVLVQFHPESFASPNGPAFLEAFCKLTQGSTLKRMTDDL